MATASVVLITALRTTARKLKDGSAYQWGHMGNCNCGNLAQELTKYTSAEIHREAVGNGRGDWNEQLNDYCPTSRLPMDSLIFELLTHGLTIDDLRHLERLSDSTILKKLPGGYRYLQHNNREDVTIYLDTWATLLEEQWCASQGFRDFGEALSHQTTDPTPITLT